MLVHNMGEITQVSVGVWLGCSWNDSVFLWTTAIVIFASVRFPGETPDLFDPDSCPMIGRYVNLEQSEGYYQGQFVAVDSRPGNIGSTRVPNLSSIPSYTRTPLFCQH